MIDYPLTPYMGSPSKAILKIIWGITSGDYGFTGSENADLIDDIHKLSELAQEESIYSLVIFDYSGHRYWGQNWNIVIVELEAGDISNYNVIDIWGYTIVSRKKVYQ